MKIYNPIIAGLSGNVSHSLGTTADSSFTGSFKGNLQGTASHADYALSASWAPGSSAISSSYSLSSSYSDTAKSSSYGLSSSYTDTALSSSYAATASLVPVASLTRAQANTLITSSGLTVGALYKITGVHKNKTGHLINVLYDDGTNAGVDIYLTAVAVNQFSKEGWGEFWNPRYDQTNYGTVDGSGSYLYNIWDGENPVSADRPSYNVGRKVIWGGYVWQNLSGSLGSYDTMTALNTTHWSKQTYNSTDYAKVVDYIEYDFVNDWICRRKQAEPIIDVVFPYQFWNSSARNTYGITLHGISVMQWGNKYNKDTSLGIGLIQVDDAYFECVNFKGSYMLGVTVDLYSYGRDNYRGKNTYFEGIVISNYSNQVNCSFQSGSSQKWLELRCISFQDSVTLNRGSDQWWTVIDNNSIHQNVSLDNASRQYYNSFMNGGSCTDLIMDNGTEMQHCTFVESSGIINVTADNLSYIDHLNLSNGSTFGTSTLSNSDIAYIVMDRASSISNSTLTDVTMQHWKLSDNTDVGVSLTGSIADTDQLSHYTLFRSNISMGNGILNDKNIQQAIGDNHTINYYFQIIFDGNPGSGQAGALTIPYMQVPHFSYIEEVSLSYDSFLAYGVGSYITLGIETDDIDSGINAEGGLLDSITTNGPVRYTLLPGTQATDDRKIVMAVGDADITAGTINIIVKVRKTNI